MAQEKYDDENFENTAEDAASEQRTAKGKRQVPQGRHAQSPGKRLGGPERQGQQKTRRSTIVLGIIGVILGAAILGGVFWVVNAGKNEESLMKNAMASLEQHQYEDADAQFLSFLEDYPKSPSAGAARIGLHRTRVEKNIMPEYPDVIKGLEELQLLLSECRDLPGFSDSKDHIRRYADRLTFAAARVAEVTQDQKALDASTAAMAILTKYAGTEGILPERVKKLERMQSLASATIAKKSEFQSRMMEARSLLQSGKSIEAVSVLDGLTDSYPGLSDDKDLQAIQIEILGMEKERVVRSEGPDALTTDDRAADFKSLSLALRTQAATDLSSQGRSVFAIGIDSVFALDADTGDPIWRQPVGVDSPFAPIAVKATEPGVLVFSTLSGELQLLSQKDGHLLWRQPLEGRPSAMPLVVSDNIFITTQNNEMWQVAVANGRALSRLKFSQPIIGPPALASDGSKLVIPGDETLVYTLSVNPLSCIAVSQIPHKAGSVKTRMLAVGKYFLMCDNVSAEKARIQMLNIDDSGVLKVEFTDSIDGQINDPCLLRDNDLFVPSTPQRVTVFRVTEKAGQPLLSRVGANQLEDGVQTRMFLLAGPGAQFWLAGRDLRKLQTQTDTILLDSGITAEGIHLQPIQFVDESVFLTTRNPQSSSVFFTRANREEMKSTWRTVLGSKLVTVGPAAGGDALLAIGDYGETYRVPMAEIAKGGFQLESTSRFRLPDKLTSSVGGVALKDGRVAAWCGAPEPSMWTFTPTGPLERKWTLPDGPQLPPVALDGGVVFAMPGRLHISAIAGGQAAEDYRAAQSQDQQRPWKSLTAISPTQVLAVNADNQFVRVEFRATPRPQLAELSVTSVPYVIELAPAVSGEFLFLATTEGKLVMMQAATLAVLAEADLGVIPDAVPKVAGSFVFVELANKDVRVFKVADGLPQAASFPLDGHALAGDPMRLSDDSYLIARTDGKLIRLNSDGTVSDSAVQLGQAIQQGPLSINGQIIVVGMDGSLYQLDSSVGK